MKRHIAAFMVILLGVVTALIVNSEHGTASENDSIKKVITITTEACKPSKRTCYTEQKGDTIVTYKGSYRERTITIVK